MTQAEHLKILLTDFQNQKTLSELLKISDLITFEIYRHCKNLRDRRVFSF